VERIVRDWRLLESAARVSCNPNRLATCMMRRDAMDAAFECRAGTGNKRRDWCRTHPARQPCHIRAVPRARRLHSPPQTCTSLANVYICIAQGTTGIISRWRCCRNAPTIRHMSCSGTPAKIRYSDLRYLPSVHGL